MKPQVNILEGTECCQPPCELGRKPFLAKLSDEITALANSLQPCRGANYAMPTLLTHAAAAAAAAKSFQSCPTLYDPIDGSHQAPLSLGFSRQEYRSGLPFPSPMHESESKVAQLCPTLSYQAPPSMGFSRQEYWSGVPLPSLPNHFRGQ